MDQATRMAERAMKLSRKIDLDARLARFQIDRTTQANLRQSNLGQSAALDGIVAKFYDYLHRFPENNAILDKTNEEKLKLSQKRHWSRLLNCDLDSQYVHNTLLIGMAHFNAKVPPQSYISSYSFFQAELFRTIIRSYSHMEFEALSISTSKVIMLDMSIALNAYLLDAMAIKT